MPLENEPTPTQADVLARVIALEAEVKSLRERLPGRFAESDSRIFARTLPTARDREPRDPPIHVERTVARLEREEELDRQRSRGDHIRRLQAAKDAKIRELVSAGMDPAAAAVQVTLADVAAAANRAWDWYRANSDVKTGDLKLGSFSAGAFKCDVLFHVDVAAPGVEFTLRCEF